MTSLTKTKTDIDVKMLTINALCIALTFVATAFINLRLPIAANGGLVHMGNVALFLAAVIFGRKTGAIAGGLGMALFDVMGGWLLWAPFTLVTVGLMGYVVGLINERHKKTQYLLLSFVAALLIKIAGYYIAEGIIYGNWIAPALSIPGNIVQVTVGAIVALPLIAAVKKAGIFNEI